MGCKLNKSEKKQIFIFLIVAFGLPALFGILMGYSFYQGIDVSVFSQAQMYYPATGAMLAILLTKNKETLVPKNFYISFFVLTIIMILVTFGSVVRPNLNWNLISQCIVIIGSFITWALLAKEKKEFLQANNLCFIGRYKTKPWLYVLLFVLLIFIKTLIGYIISGDIKEYFNLFRNEQFWLQLIMLPIIFIFVYTAFFGEEYGWRFFLQPLLQKRFGKRIGVILLGVLWGIWHLPINMFYYSPTTWVQSAVTQQIVCISFAIFFGYTYMKTHNIWVPVILHYLNNNLNAVLFGATDITNEIIDWTDVGFVFVIYCVLFGIFIMTKEYRDPNKHSITYAR